MPKLANSLFGQKVRSRNTIRSLGDLPNCPFAQQLRFKEPIPILQLLRGPGLIRNAIGGWALLKKNARALSNPRQNLVTGPPPCAKSPRESALLPDCLWMAARSWRRALRRGGSDRSIELQVSENAKIFVNHLPTTKIAKQENFTIFGQP